MKNLSLTIFVTIALFSFNSQAANSDGSGTTPESMAACQIMLLAGLDANSDGSGTSPIGTDANSDGSGTSPDNNGTEANSDGSGTTPSSAEYASCIGKLSKNSGK